VAKVKEEDNPNKRRKRKKMPGKMIIDLTGDSEEERERNAFVIDGK